MKVSSAALWAGASALLLLSVPAAGAASETVLYAFCGQQNCADGGQPQAGLTSVGGTLYGTGSYGGTNDNRGVLFSLDAGTGAETVLHDFENSAGDAQYPDTTLLAVKGVLYGTSTEGGASGSGTVYAFDLKTGAESVLHSFGGSSKDGKYPAAGLIAAKGKLYGTAAAAGAGGGGIVFSIDPKTGAEKVVYAFGGTDGYGPAATLLSVKDTLYGTTASGGTGSCDSGCGTIFSLDPKTGAEKVLYSFCGPACGDGEAPQGALIEEKGILYGTTTSGGGGAAGGSGTVFSFDLAKKRETVLYSFQSNGSDGANPWGRLTWLKGALIGVTKLGGSNQEGTVFSVDSDTGAETVLHTFEDNGTDGEWPNGDLLAIKGTLYGTTYVGGAHALGAAFEITP